MSEDQKKSPRPPKKGPQACCDTCEFFDWDEWYEEYVCTQDLDEDEMSRFLAGSFSSCPYYRFYDEYKLVQKQN